MLEAEGCWFARFVPAVLCNMIRLVANKATPGLGLACSICRPKMRLRGIKAFVLLFFFFEKSGCLAHIRSRSIRDIVLLEVSATRTLVHL